MADSMAAYFHTAVSKQPDLPMMMPIGT
jgi:hypothetical protein